MNSKHKIAAVILLYIGIASSQVHGQIPYYEIPSAPEKISAGGVASRMIDGLGFRFYWATEGLRAEDLSYKPGANARTCLETIEHIHGMSITLLNTTTHTPTLRNQNSKISFEEMRKQTLMNLKTISDRFRASTDTQLESYSMIFGSGDQKTEYAFWNQLNGPIADCLWHVGQIVSMRRASGNPFSDKVNVLTGTVRK
jgi:hypothetical protein